MLHLAPQPFCSDALVSDAEVVIDMIRETDFFASFERERKARGGQELEGRDREAEKIDLVIHPTQKLTLNLSFTLRIKCRKSSDARPSKTRKGSPSAEMSRPKKQ